MPLPLGEAARAGLDPLDHFVAVELAGQEAEHFAIADGLAGRAARVARPARRSDRRTSSTRPASIIASTRPSIRWCSSSRCAPQHEHAALVGRPAFVELHLLMADRLAGRAKHFQRADQPPRVVRMNVATPPPDRPASAARGAPAARRRSSSCFDLVAQSANRPAGRRTGRAAELFRYSGVPPTNSTSRPRARECRRPSSAAASTYCATLYSSAGSTMSMQVMRHGGPLGRPTAWPCRCPCRDRWPSSRAR